MMIMSFKWTMVIIVTQIEDKGLVSALLLNILDKKFTITDVISNERAINLLVFKLICRSFNNTVIWSLVTKKTLRNPRLQQSVLISHIDWNSLENVGKRIMFKIFDGLHPTIMMG